MHCSPEQEQLLTAIASALGEEWRFEAHEERPRLVSPDLGLTCHFPAYGAQRRRLILSLKADGLFSYRPPQEAYPEISVDPNRNSFALARDIKHRLIPQARRLLAAMLDAKARNDAYEQQTAALLAELRSLLGVEPWDKALHFYGKRLRLSVEASGDEASLEMRHVPADLAKRICRLVAEYENEEV